MPRLTWILMAVIASSWLAASAGADTLKDQARKAVVAGLDAQAAGRYDEAIAFYRKAYDAVPHPEILFNLAQAYRLKGDAETALGLYQRYLAVEPKGRVAPDARKWVAALEKVTAQRKSDLAKTDAARTDAARKSDLAKTEAARTDAARKPDLAKTDAARTDAARKSDLAKTDAARTDAARKSDLAKTDAARTDAARKSDLAKMDAARTDAASNTDAARRAPPPRTSNVAVLGPGEPRDDGAAFSQRRRYAVIAAATGGALVLGSAVLGDFARSKRNAAVAICGDDRMCDSAEDTSRANALLAASRTRGTASTVLFVLGGAGIATGAVLWFTGRETTTRSALAPVLAPSVVGLAWGGRF